MKQSLKPHTLLPQQHQRRDQISPRALQLLDESCVACRCALRLHFEGAGSGRWPGCGIAVQRTASIGPRNHVHAGSR